MNHREPFGAKQIEFLAFTYIMKKVLTDSNKRLRSNSLGLPLIKCKSVTMLIVKQSVSWLLFMHSQFSLHLAQFCICLHVNCAFNVYIWLFPVISLHLHRCIGTCAYWSNLSHSAQFFIVVLYILISKWIPRQIFGGFAQFIQDQTDLFHHNAPQEVAPACGHQTVQLLPQCVRHWVSK